MFRIIPDGIQSYGDEDLGSQLLRDPELARADITNRKRFEISFHYYFKSVYK